MTDKPTVQVVSRLTQSAYAAFRKTLPAPCLPKTDLEAGFMCGVDFVLTKLREGYVHEPQE